MRNLFYFILMSLLATTALAAGGGTVGNERGDSFLDDLVGFYQPAEFTEQCMGLGAEVDGGTRLAGSTAKNGVALYADAFSVMDTDYYFRFRSGKGEKIVTFGDPQMTEKVMWETDEVSKVSTIRRFYPDDQEGWRETWKITLRMINKDHFIVTFGLSMFCEFNRK
jgi:hypothetical protein